MREHCLKRLKNRFTVKSFKFWGFKTSVTSNFFDAIWRFVPQENTYNYTDDILILITV